MNIPEHLQRFPWYEKHLAWLRKEDGGERAYLRGTDLRGTDLSGANLRGANLRGADLSDAEIPRVENIDAKIISALEAGGSLDMSHCHTCGTTHCRAGWAIHLAGEAGGNLERAVGSNAAGAMIYAVSRPNKRVPDFYASDEEALVDICACAAEDKQ